MATRTAGAKKTGTQRGSRGKTAKSAKSAGAANARGTARRSTGTKSAKRTTKSRSGGSVVGKLVPNAIGPAKSMAHKGAEFIEGMMPGKSTRSGKRGSKSRGRPKGAE